MQDQKPRPVQPQWKALQTGTLFPAWTCRLKAAIQAKTKMANTALVELMALDFAIDELGLYLVTHSNDQEVLQLYWSYIKLAKEGREKYQKMYGPLLQTDLTPEDGYAWLKDPGRGTKEGTTDVYYEKSSNIVKIKNTNRSWPPSSSPSMAVQTVNWGPPCGI